MIREDWVEVELGHVCEKVAKVKRKEMPLEQPLIYIDIGGIDNALNKIVDHKEYTWSDAPSRAQQVVRVGDVLFSTVRTYLKNVAQVTNPKYNNEICSSGFTVIRGQEGILHPRYVFYLTLFEGFLQPLNELQTGTSYPAVRDRDVFAQRIRLAPFPEQRAIVAKIEQLFSGLDNGIANLKAAKDKLEIYRQAVLKKAFEGELTKEWRIRNGLGEWRTMPLSDVGDIITGTTPPKKNSEYYVPREYNFYKPSDLNAGHNVVSSIDRLSREGYEVGRKAPENSVLVTCIGATIGKAGFIRKEGCFNQQINAILPFGRYNPKFVYYQVIGADFQEQIQSEASATTLPILNKRKFSGLTIRVCSEQEQVQVVLEIEKRLSVCDKVQISIEEEVEKANLLRQSILKKAFEGSLLTRYELDACRKEPDWEPVDKLLERIKKQRNEQV